MKKLLFTITMLVSVTVLFFAFSMSASAETYGDLTYGVMDGEVIITDCSESVIAIEIPEEIDGYSVTRIDDRAFIDCTRLIKITIPDSVKSIGIMAFDSCSRLENIIIPDSVILIEAYAFYGCSSLEKVFIPASVKSVDLWAFMDCYALKSVYFGGSMDEWNALDYDFDGNVTLYYEHKHDYDVTTTVATCSETGESEYVCECGISYTEDIPATGHTLGSWEVVKAAQVGKKGLEQQRCTVCNTVVNERDIPALPEESTKPVEKPTDKPVEKPDAVKNFGDVDGNGKITAADARLALRISAKLEKATELQTTVADMDKNGKITAADARKILRVSAKLETI